MTDLSFVRTSPIAVGVGRRASCAAMVPTLSNERRHVNDFPCGTRRLCSCKLLNMSDGKTLGNARAAIAEQCRREAMALALAGLVEPKPCAVCGRRVVESFHVDASGNGVAWLCRHHHYASHGVELCGCGEQKEPDRRYCPRCDRRKTRKGSICPNPRATAGRPATISARDA